MTDIERLEEIHARLQRRGMTYADRNALWDQYRAIADRLVAGLSVGAGVAYAYSPRESVRSGGKTHLVLSEPLAVGRLQRAAGDALCKPARQFWQLDGRPQGTHVACIACLRIAAKLQRQEATPMDTETVFTIEAKASWDIRWFEKRRVLSQGDVIKTVEITVPTADAAQFSEWLSNNSSVFHHTYQSNQVPA